MSRGLRVVVVGAGFGGIAAGIELRAHGIDGVGGLERAPGVVRGTWLHTTYPGAACDVPSHLSSYSFAQRRDWSRLCSPQPEILEYARGVAARHGVDRLGRAGGGGPGRAGGAPEFSRAAPQRHPPAIPTLPGAETFAGHAFHSARWDHDHDLRDRRVAV